jgi:hypothetical protein
MSFFYRVVTKKYENGFFFRMDHPWKFYQLMSNGTPFKKAPTESPTPLKNHNKTPLAKIPKIKAERKTPNTETKKGHFPRAFPNPACAKFPN